MSESIESLLKEKRVFPPPGDFRARARVSSEEEYERLYRRSIETPDEFWGEQAARCLHWFEPWHSVCKFAPSRVGREAAPYLEFFSGGKLNVSFNCLDRHVAAGLGDRVAIFWQGEREEERRTITYHQLWQDVCRFANVLRSLGAREGTTVTIYMPLVPETVVAMLACTRIGAIHSIVFSAFSSDSLRSRINDCGSQIVITADVAFHGGKTIALKENVDRALLDTPTVQHVVVCCRGEGNVSMNPGRDFWWGDLVPQVVGECAPTPMDAEAPLFILYTSGSTGKPKGVLHTTGGYSLYAHLTFEFVFDYRPEDIFWCTADVGWITGHSYVVYGPLSNGATVVLFEGVPTYPQPDRFWEIIERYGVTIFYTAPTAIRALMRLGDEWPNKHNLSSLRLLGSVGEPINPEAWIWYHRVIGKERCPIVDTWWQTETGGIAITTLPGALPSKPGAGGKPFFGIVPEVLRPDGAKAETDEGGSLVLGGAWPGMLRGVYGDAKSELIHKVYFSQFPGKYFTGDGCRVDSDGYHWLLGRIDDVINVSAHRFATAEIESALVSHSTVAEAAVVGVPHEVKGQGIYCFVTLKSGVPDSSALRDELVRHVRTEISPIATPEAIQFAPALPKTRSGKIMRRILRKIAEGTTDGLGDTSTLADPSVVDSLIAGRKS